MTRFALGDIRVADFTWVWAGPFCTMLLSLMGAEVIKVESHRRLDVVRGLPPASFKDREVQKRYAEWAKQPPGERALAPPARPGIDQSGYFNRMNHNKLSVAIDLTQPEGVELARRLVAVSDVVIDNFTPRVMKGFGLDYATLSQKMPDIVCLSTAGAGSTGPFSNWVLYGPLLSALSGLCSLTGYPDGPPLPTPISWGDPIAGFLAAFALLSALHYRSRTGQGQNIDLSQWEGAVSLLPEEILDYIMNQRMRPRMGNHDVLMAPHACYPCQGEDRWLSIAVASEQEWQGLCQAMGNPEWASEQRFSDAYQRWKNQEELDRRLSAWTRNYSPYELTALLQAKGVAATPSLNNEEVVKDPQLNARGFFVEIDHPETGPFLHPGLPFKLSATPGEVRRAPLLGEHYEYVLGELLGLPHRHIQKLMDDKVLF